MKTHSSVILLLIALLAISCATAPSPQLDSPQEAQHGSAPDWQPWEQALFARAAQEDKLVILHLGAMWCHWCHVMERDTYGDAQIQSILAQGYLASHVDHEQRPDLANRYERYGWPATIIFDAQGRELFKRAGYIPAQEMAALLQKLSRDPQPLRGETDRRATTAQGDAGLSPEQAQEINRFLHDNYQPQDHSWSQRTRGLRWACVEELMRQPAPWPQAARAHTDASLQLVDPVWGGVYQYSTRSRWTSPHYEKLMLYQAEGLRLYGLAWAKWSDPKHQEAAQKTAGYLMTMLRSPEGAFYTSQDADLIPGQKADDFFALDDAQRRARGIPAINKELYARENGMAIRALAAWYALSGDPEALQAALGGAQWALQRRSLPGGGFRHGEDDQGSGPFLGDSVAMGAAMLQLYEVTGEQAWLERSSETASFVLQHFVRRDDAQRAIPGLVSSASGQRANAAFAPLPQLEENLAAARWLNLLHHYTGRPELRQAAGQSLAWVGQSRAWTSDWCPGGPLLAQQELQAQPLHVTVVGSKQDQAARALFTQALRYPQWYRRVDWQEPGQPPLPHAQTEYPELGRAAAFLCANGVCSAPLFSPEALTAKMEDFEQRLWPQEP